MTESRRRIVPFVAPPAPAQITPSDGRTTPEEVINHAEPLPSKLVAAEAPDHNDGARESTRDPRDGARVTQASGATAPAPATMKARGRTMFGSFNRRSGRPTKNERAARALSGDPDSSFNAAALDFELGDLGGCVDENDIRATAMEDAPLPIELVIAEERDDFDDDDAETKSTNPSATPERLALIKAAWARYVARRGAGDGEAA